MGRPARAGFKTAAPSSRYPERTNPACFRPGRIKPRVAPRPTPGLQTINAPEHRLDRLSNRGPLGGRASWLFQRISPGLSLLPLADPRIAPVNERIRVSTSVHTSPRACADKPLISRGGSDGLIFAGRGWHKEVRDASGTLLLACSYCSRARFRGWATACDSERIDRSCTSNTPQFKETPHEIL
jgi:hypothetical protein